MSDPRDRIPRPARSVGLMGGTFDPIHLGHLVAADAARHALGLERVIFVPASQPPHKLGSAITSGDHRFAMTLLATLDHPAFEVSRVELDRPSPSYTVETLRHFRALWPDADLWFITGADAILEILNWREPEELLALARFVAATRPGHPLGRLKAVKEALGPAARGRIRSLEVPALAIASRDLRERVRTGRPIRYLVPREVEAYIAKTGLYLDSDGGARERGSGASGRPSAAGEIGELAAAADVARAGSGPARRASGRRRGTDARAGAAHAGD